jgi:hypothetical protein
MSDGAAPHIAEMTATLKARQEQAKKAEAEKVVPINEKTKKD